MRTPSGELHVCDFKTGQIVSSIQPADYWDDKRHWEIKNNIDTLEFRVFDNTRHSSTLMQQNLVLKEVRDGRIVPYVITEIEKDSDDRSVIAYASGEWIQLAKAGIIPPQKLEGKTVIEMVDIALAGTKWQKGNLEYVSFRSMTIDEFIDPLSFLKKIASLFELEIQYRAEVVGSQVVGRYVDMVKKRGQETGKEITLGKDLLGIKRIENSQNICTALLGFVKKEGGEFITITEINKGVPYLVDNDAFQRWNEKGNHKFGFYSPETENDDMDAKRLMTLMNTELKKRVNTSVSYEVEAQSIGRVFGLAHELINEGDTIRIKDTGFTPKLYLEARAISGDESFKNPLQDKYVFGDYHEIIDPNEELRRIYNRILSSLGNKQEMINQLDKLVKEANETASNAKKESEAAKTLAEKVQENIKNNTVEIIESKHPPTTGLKDRKTLWLDISNGKPGILKLWKDGIWDPVVPDVESVKKETIEQVSKDIESTKTELNQKVQSVEGKAQEIAGQIVGVQKQVNDKVDQTWINNQLEDKADKSGVYTKDEIKAGFIGKQTYETDKQGNVQKFKDVNTSISQTNEALKQKAEKSDLTKTNDGLTKLQNKTNEIETTASGTKQKLSELETTVNNTNIGVRNYVLDSDKFILPPNTVQGFSFVNDLKDLQGKQVTLSVYVEIKNAKTGVNPSNRIGFEPSIRYSDNSIQHLGAWLRITDGMNFKGVISTTVWIKDIGILKTEQNAVYIQCGGDYVKVGRPKIEIGNKVTDWTPAPEDNVSNTDFTKKTVEIETTIKGINTSVSNVQNEQGKLAERVTKSEQTADGFKQSIESLTKKDSEISNKLNTVESTVEGTKKTISNVQQTTSELTKITTEIKEEARRTKERMEQINSKVDSLEVGATNMINGTEFINANGWSRWGNYGAVNVINESALTSLPTPYSLRMETVIDGKQQIVPNGTQVGMRSHDCKFKVKKGQKYTVSFNVATSELGWLLDYVYIMYTVEGGNRRIPDINTLDFPIVAKINDRQNNNYYRVHFTFTADRDDDQAFLLITGTTKRALDGKNGYAWIRVNALKIEKGTIATDWDTSNADKVSLNEFTKKTTEIEKSVGGIKETITKVENNQSGFDKRVTEVEKTANGITQNVSKLQETQTQQGKTLTQATTTLEQHSEALNLTMKKKDVENYVGGLGAINEILDAGFTQGNKYWGWSNGHAIDPNLKYKGYNSFSMHTTGQDQDRWWGAFGQFIDCSPYEDIVVSAYFNTDGKVPIDNGVYIEMEFWQSNKTTRISTARERVQIINNTWIKSTCTAKAPAGTGFVRFRPYIQRNGRAWFCMPMLQRGKVATEFWLHPKDQVDADKMLEDIANRVATEQYNQKMTQIDNRFSVNEKGIDLAAKKTEVYTQTQSNDKFATNAYVRNMEGRIQVTEKNILSTVKKGEIISSINQTAEKIKISANLIDLVGRVEASWLKAGLLQGMTIKTSATKEYLHMENQVIRFVNQGSAKIVMGFEDERKSTTRNPYIILGEGDGTGRNIGSIYKDGNGVYYRYVDYNGAESNIRLTNAGNIGITAQDGIWFTAKRANFTSPISTSGILFNSFGKIPLSQQGVLWMGNGYRGFGAYYHDGKAWNFISSSQ
ncbi:phage tail protein [Bacillus cytotoxicus]|uniref:phage tail spike protein n=1 Tax=Bacillus cereus group sp. BfR-BA-01492 TaxID=2920361 RepID=UPI001F59C89A|nr:phage tail spike protein [Bacillus cereus group sp. BfR-BA-01492]EMA6345058.1 phage tail protein [Bacillus cytotoxicus]